MREHGSHLYWLANDYATASYPAALADPAPAVRRNGPITEMRDLVFSSADAAPCRPGPGTERRTLRVPGGKCDGPYPAPGWAATPCSPSSSSSPTTSGPFRCDLGYTVVALTTCLRRRLAGA